MKVICAGFPKTGTKSMANALRTLGYSVHDFEEHLEYNLENYVDYLEGRVGEEVFLEMYHKAGRDPPSYFPREEPENIYDMDAIFCREIESWGLFSEETKKTTEGSILKLEFETDRYGKSKTLEAFRGREVDNVGR